MINVNHYMSVCHGQIIQNSYSQHIRVDAALFQFEVIPLLISAETLASVLGIKLQLIESSCLTHVDHFMVNLNGES